jgi:signal transduction histidine kinase
VEDLSLHILDVVENSLRAGARRVEVRLLQHGDGRLLLTIRDDGRGMDSAERERALSPFFTSKGNKRFGLGLPLLAQAAQETGGGLTLESAPGAGTTVSAVFHADHIDMKPLGDLARTLRVLQATHPEVDFVLEVMEQ